MDTRSLDSVNSVSSGIDFEVIKNRQFQSSVQLTESNFDNEDNETDKIEKPKNIIDLLLEWITNDDRPIEDTSTLYNVSTAKYSKLSSKVKSTMLLIENTKTKSAQTMHKTIKCGIETAIEAIQHYVTKTAETVNRSRKIQRNIKKYGKKEIIDANNAFIKSKQSLQQEMIGGRQDSMYREALRKARISWNLALERMLPIFSKLLNEPELGDRNKTLIRKTILLIKMELKDNGYKGSVLELMSRFQSRIHEVTYHIKELMTSYIVQIDNTCKTNSGEEIETFKSLNNEVISAKKLQESIIRKISVATPDLDGLETKLLNVSNKIETLEKQINEMIPVMVPCSEGKNVPQLKSALIQCENMETQLQKMFDSLSEKRRKFEDEVDKYSKRLREKCKSIEDGWQRALTNEKQKTIEYIEHLTTSLKNLLSETELQLTACINFERRHHNSIRHDMTRDMGETLGHYFQTNLSLNMSKVLLTLEI